MTVAKTKKQEIDFKVLARELLRSVRGRRSQDQINRRLGFNFNRVSRWETGRAEISWPDFVHICKSCRVSVSDAMHKTYSTAVEAEDSAAVIRFFKGSLKISAFATHLGVSRFTVHRWLSGETLPTLSQMLMIVHQMTATLTLFVDKLLPGSSPPALLHLTRHEQSLREVIFSHPYVLAALACFELDEFKRMQTWSRGILVQKLRISQHEEDQLIERLTKIKQLRRRGEMLEVADMRIDIRNDFAGKNQLRQYWTRKALDMLLAIRETTKVSQFGFFTYAASEEARENIREAYLKFYQEVTSILDADSGPKTVIQTANFQILDLDEMNQTLDASSRPALLKRN